MGGKGAPEIVAGEVEAEKATEGGDLRWDLAGDVVVGEVNEFEIETVYNWGEGAVKAVVMEVDEAELVERGERFNGATEVEGREGESGDAAIGAFYADPRS